MLGKHPPKWLFDRAVTLFEFTNEPNQWEYRNPYYEAPYCIICPHCGPSEEVQIHSVANGEKDIHVIGQCNKCNRVYWTELGER